jgi:hypothetical protein
MAGWIVRVTYEGADAAQGEQFYDVALEDRDSAIAAVQEIIGEKREARIDALAPIPIIDFDALDLHPGEVRHRSSGL